MDQLFNAEQFLQTTVTEANSTELLNVPEGEYVAVSGPVTPENFRSYDIKKGDRAGTKGYALDLEWMINDESGALKAYLGRAPKVRHSLNLEIRADGSLEFGKGRNVELGRLRDALGQNGSGQPWAMPMLGSQVAKIKVKHTLDAATGRTYVNVTSVAKVS
jgi:hypothetical protein